MTVPPIGVRTTSPVHGATESLLAPKNPKFRLQSLLVGLAGADADDLCDGINENFSITDFTGSGGFDDGIDGFFAFLGFHANLDEHLGYKTHVHSRAAIALRVSHLPAESFAFDRRDAKNSDFRQCLFNRINLVRLNDCFDHLHRGPLDQTSFDRHYRTCQCKAQSAGSLPGTPMRNHWKGAAYNFGASPDSGPQLRGVRPKTMQFAPARL